MERQSSKHGPKLDDEMKKEVEGQVRAGHPTRAEEWHDPEPPIGEEGTPEKPGTRSGQGDEDRA